MNFKRIQEIFLLAFIVLDVFLFMMTQHNNVQKDSNQNNNKNSAIIKQMKHDHITTGHLSDKRGYGYYVSANPDHNLATQSNQLTNQNIQVVNDTLQSDFKKNVSLNANKPEKTLNQKLKNKHFVIAGSQYRYNDTVSNDHQLVYDQHLINGPVDSSNGRIIFKLNAKNQLVGYTQTKLTGIKILHEKARLISEERAVIWLYQYNDIPNNSSLVWARRSYARLLHIGKNDVYVPTWVIKTYSHTTHKTKINRVNGFTGASFKTQRLHQPNAAAHGVTTQPEGGNQ